jgi:hypothetical protein
MAQAQKPTVRFNKGLITEAGELTFPEGASIDELNCDLDRDGARRRRKSIQYEADNQFSEFETLGNRVLAVGEWKNVGEVSGLDFTVIQTGARLYFYNKGVITKSAGSIEASRTNSDLATVNLLNYEAPLSVGAANAPCQFASLNGALIVVSEGIDPIRITRDPVTRAFSVRVINIRVRDLEWQGSVENYDEQTATPSIARKYDTYNAGWDNSTANNVTSALAQYQADRGEAWPPLTHPWFSGKDADDNFSTALWLAVYGGTSLIGNGHFILDFFKKNRAAVSPLTLEEFEAAGVKAVETEKSRFTTVVSYAGRVFYSGIRGGKNANKVLYTKLVESEEDLGTCHQVNDPTSEIAPDLLDTDGGVIPIPGASNVTQLSVLGDSLLVFTTNGVWQVRGIDGVFTATAYSVIKVTEIGMESPKSYVSADGVPFWWSDHGIHTLSFNEVAQRAQEVNLSLTTIQSFYEEIDVEARRECVGEFDDINKRVYWLYPSNGETTPNKKNRILILDVPLQAFIPWEISDKRRQSPYIVDMIAYRPYLTTVSETNVIDSEGNIVVDSSGDAVTAEGSVETTFSLSLQFLVRDPATNKITFAEMTGNDFLDWGAADYSSYAEAGYEFLGDMLLKKTAPYILVYSRTTETRWDGLFPDFPSSLVVSLAWDFNKTFTQPQQAYRFKSHGVSGATWDYPDSVISTRLKLRGRGRTMRLRFDSEEGKDFILLGYTVVGDVPPRY